MKLQAPEGCGGAAFNGQVLDMTEDGVVEAVTPELIETLRAHGFTEVPAEVPPMPWVKPKKGQ